MLHGACNLRLCPIHVTRPLTITQQLNKPRLTVTYVQNSPTQCTCSLVHLLTLSLAHSLTPPIPRTLASSHLRSPPLSPSPSSLSCRQAVSRRTSDAHSTAHSTAYGSGSEASDVDHHSETASVARLLPPPRAQSLPQSESAVPEKRCDLRRRFVYFNSSWLCMFFSRGGGLYSTTKKKGGGAIFNKTGGPLSPAPAVPGGDHLFTPFTPSLHSTPLRPF